MKPCEKFRGVWNWERLHFWTPGQWQGAATETFFVKRPNRNLFHNILYWTGVIMIFAFVKEFLYVKSQPEKYQTGALSVR